MTVILVAASDLHIISTIGLCPPDVELQEGGTYKASDAQLWMYTKWVKTWERIQRLKEENAAELWTVLNGDVVDGDHHNTFEIISRSPATMFHMATKLLEPIANTSDRFFVVRGTEVHTGKSGYMEEKIAKDLGAEKDPDTDTFSWWILRMEAEGVKFEFAHHGRFGRRPWTGSNSLNAIAVETVYNYNGLGWCPDVVVRSHYHRYASTGVNHRDVRVVSLPAWQLATSYVKRIDPQAIADIGLVIFICENGKYTEEVIRYTPELGTIWKP